MPDEVINQQQNQEDFEQAFNETETPAVENTTPEEPKEEVPKEEPTPKDEDAPADDLQSKLDEQTQKMKSWEGRLSAQDKVIKDLEAKLADKEASTQPPVPEVTLSEDDEKLIESFTSEMGEDFIKPVKALVTKLAQEIVNNALKGVKQEVSEVKTVSEEQKIRDHFNTIEKAHPDLKKLMETDAVNTWIETLPFAEAKKAMEIVEHGDTTSVIELISNYKKAKGITVVKDKVDINKVNKAAAVKGVGPGVLPKGEPDKDDFEGTFEAITKTS